MAPFWNSPCKKGAASALFSRCLMEERRSGALSPKETSTFFGSRGATGTPAFGWAIRSGGCAAAAGGRVNTRSRAAGAGRRRAGARAGRRRTCSAQPRICPTGRGSGPCGARFARSRRGWRPTGLIRRSRSGLCGLCKYAADGERQSACCKRQCELPHRFLSRPVVIGSATPCWV